MGLYERIRDVANSRGYSINQLEKELGFARSSICKFNKNIPSTEKMQQIADFFNVSVDYLLTGATTNTLQEALIDDPETLNMLHEYYSLNTHTQTLIQQLIHEMYQLQRGSK